MVGRPKIPQYRIHAHVDHKTLLPVYRVVYLEGPLKEVREGTHLTDPDPTRQTPIGTDYTTIGMCEQAIKLHSASRRLAAKDNMREYYSEAVPVQGVLT